MPRYIACGGIPCPIRKIKDPNLTLQAFISQNHDKILRDIKNTPREKKLALMSNLYVHLHDRWEKFESRPEKEVVAYSVRFAFNESRWRKADRRDQPKESYLEDHRAPASSAEPEDEPYSQDPSAYHDHRVDTWCEMPTDDTRDYLYDLVQNYAPRQVDRIIGTRLAVEALDKPEYILYDMYINRNMSYSEMAEAIKIPKTSVYQMMERVMEKIRKAVEKI